MTEPSESPRSVDELEAELADVNEKRDQLKNHARALTLELDTARALEAATEKVAQMSDVERAALAQAIAPTGIESTTAVGTPGN